VDGPKWGERAGTCNAVISPWEAREDKVVNPNGKVAGV
jgi:hypothetical protein